jgi:hypothetical protein
VITVNRRLALQSATSCGENLMSSSQTFHASLVALLAFGFRAVAFIPTGWYVTKS